MHSFVCYISQIRKKAQIQFVYQCPLWFISSVLYFSIHRYDHAQFFPFSTSANFDVVGNGPGKGYTVNVPWNEVNEEELLQLPSIFQININSFV